QLPNSYQTPVLFLRYYIKQMLCKYRLVKISLLLNPFRVPGVAFHFFRIPSGVIQVKPLRGLGSEFP
ncbi:MAG TPA: hypothetical protein VGK38_01840, partial [Prolixibacteraceae bacterium]